MSDERTRLPLSGSRFVESYRGEADPAGGGMCLEADCDVPDEFPFVNHVFGHGQKGATGFLVVEP